VRIPFKKRNEARSVTKREYINQFVVSIISFQFVHRWCHVLIGEMKIVLLDRFDVFMTR